MNCHYGVDDFLQSRQSRTFRVLGTSSHSSGLQLEMRMRLGSVLLKPFFHVCVERHDVSTMDQKDMHVFSGVFKGEGRWSPFGPTVIFFG